MQNIPGLSFFDGLTKSRHSPARHSPGAGASGPGSPLVETPLKEAGPFSRLRSTKSTNALKDPLSNHTTAGYSADEDDDGQDPLPPLPPSGGDALAGHPASDTASSSSLTSSSSSSLPVTSFSRRAATVSAGSPSPARASILPRNIGNVFAERSPAKNSSSTTTTTTTSPSAAAATTTTPRSTPVIPVQRRSSEASQKSIASARIPQEPAAEDIQKLGQGSLGYAMLDKIQEHPLELADIIRLLVAKKAMLVLPTAPTTAETTLDRGYFEDHAIIIETNQPESLFVTMSGIQGVLQPANLAILGLASGHDFTSRVSDAATVATGPMKRSFFDTLTKPNSSVPSSSLHRVQDVRIDSVSKDPVIITIDSVGSIHALLTNTRILRPESPPLATPVVASSPAPLSTPTLSTTSAVVAARSRRSNSRSSSISSVGTQDRPPLFAALRRSTNSSSSSSALLGLKEDKDSIVPRSPRIALDLPLEWDNMVQDLESFIVKIKRHPHQDMDKYAHEFQRKYDDVRHRFEVYASQTGLHQRWSDNDYDEMQQWVEALLCHELYHFIFSQSDSVDFLHDEQLQAKIAALNFLDLTLEHLGFVLDSPEDVEHIAQVVREGGQELQKLAQFKAPMDKLHVLMSSHRVVVDTLNRDPAVQSKLKEEEEKKKDQQVVVTVEAAAEEADDKKVIVEPAAAPPVQQQQLQQQQKTLTTQPASPTSTKRRSMPRIMMDEGFQDRRASVEGVRSPRIPMDGDENDPSNFSAFKLDPPAEAQEAVLDPASVPVPDTPTEEEEEEEENKAETLPNQENVEETLSKPEKEEGKEKDANESKAEPDASRDTTATTTHATTSKENAGGSPGKEQVDGDGRDGAQANADGFEGKKEEQDNEQAKQATRATAATVTTVTTNMASQGADAASTSGKHYSADVLLPLLIFSVVKSNPPNLIANLRFIQRFRVQDQLSGEAAYCLTNIMAVVSFLEEIDPQALGLSSHVRVMSDMTDLQQQQQHSSLSTSHHLRGSSASTASPLVQLQEGIDQTRALGQKVGQELVDAAEEGLKVISDVVQDGYSKFFGRFLTATDGLPASAASGHRRPGGSGVGRTSPLAISSSINSSSSNSLGKGLISQAEMDREKVSVATTPGDRIGRAAAVTGRVSGTTGDEVVVERSSVHESAMEHAAKSRVMDLIATSEGPMLTYMACTDAGDLRISDIQALLDDYQRLGRLVEQLKRSGRH